jgi:hypothetical protein
VLLLDPPLRKVTIASLHQADKDNSEMLYCTTVGFEVDVRLVQTIALGRGAGIGQVFGNAVAQTGGARRAA